jgi:hypothetical protein
MLYLQIAVFSRQIAREKIAVPRIAIVRSLNLRAECQRPETPAGFILGVRGGGGWQSTEHWKADCQGDNIVVAVRGIRVGGLAMEWKPAPAILHRETSWLKCSIYLKRDFTSLKLIRGALCRSKLYVNGLSWHTIS